MTPQDDTRPTPPSLGDRPTRPRPEGTSTEAPDPAATVVTDPTTLPAVVPGFEMGGELGRGAMGVVYEATQPGLNRPVAVKMFLGEAAEDGLDVVPRHAGRHPGRSDVGRRHSGGKFRFWRQARARFGF